MGVDCCFIRSDILHHDGYQTHILFKSRQEASRPSSMIYMIHLYSPFLVALFRNGISSSCCKYISSCIVWYMLILFSTRWVFCEYINPLPRRRVNLMYSWKPQYLSAHGLVCLLWEEILFHCWNSREFGSSKVVLCFPESWLRLVTTYSFSVSSFPASASFWYYSIVRELVLCWMSEPPPSVLVSKKSQKVYRLSSSIPSKWHGERCCKNVLF